MLQRMKHALNAPRDARNNIAAVGCAKKVHALIRLRFLCFAQEGCNLYTASPSTEITVRGSAVSSRTVPQLLL
ncbi:hypothetical protein [Paenibacillus cymbidii]|uniref:hypothetical protein n=1 Tax=Paenibacillus cymbidii TaxID=1639034 RepID=UPI001436942C|nr:hypothetical protein [Paenibacillus cymbidii]